MHINPTDSVAPKTPSLQQAENFLVFRHASFRQFLEQAEDFPAISHCAAR